MDEAGALIEIERIRTLLSNFGWKIPKQKISEKEIELVIEKQFPVPVATETPK
jgi:hypothetical protein